MATSTPGVWEYRAANFLGFEILASIIILFKRF
jgi:hypothetical protein